jgi:protein-S-isoprenylcysteine O-methyltransferase Ste14
MTLLELAALSWLVWASYWILARRFVKTTKSTEGAGLGMLHVIPLAVGIYLIFHGSASGVLWWPLYVSPLLQWVGVAMTVFGLLFAVWSRLHLGRNWSAMVTLKEGHELVRSGPYRFVRHPLYTGFLTALVASAVVAETGDAFIGVAIIIVAYLVKMGREEKVLTLEFGEKYRTYTHDVARLVPFVY